MARTRPDLVTTWCDGNPALIDALDETIARLGATREALADGGSVRELAVDGHRARMDWEHRDARPVEVPADAAALRALGAVGGWITAVVREPGGIRLLGQRPVGAA